MAELLVEDYTRKGYVDGISIRLPTIVVRPDKFQQPATSTSHLNFLSSMIREPLNGQSTVVPVNLDLRHTVASPQAAVQYLLHAGFVMKAPQEAGDRTLQMPGVSLTVKEMIQALERVKGNDEATKLIQHKADPEIMRLVEHWPKELEAKRALQLGFVPDKSYDQILNHYMKDFGIPYNSNGDNCEKDTKADTRKRKSEML